ncbi:MAG: hypothetical protein HY300_01220 [Verrucomicrobia bacterium]|nr:hypothetical protein [Verrucomicrobiota bacterium]
MKAIRLFALFAIAGALAAFAAAQQQDKTPPPAKQADERIDWNKARELHQRAQRGEKLTPEEQAYYDRARKAIATRNAQPQQNNQQPPAPAQHFTPLTELGSQKYQNQDGGLYGSGRNEPPKEHAELARRASTQIRPLDTDGNSSDDGKVVLLSLGMSNTTMEFSRFKQIADAFPDKSPRLVIVDGAQGGQDAQKTSDPEHPFWTEVERRVRAAGVTPRQVQAVWLKQAVIAPTGDFATETKRLQGYITRIVQTAKQRYPNLRVAYLSSRIYAGYAVTRLNPEPYSYDSAFAVRGLILDQAAGAATLNADPTRGEVKAPVLLWGPYLWADGETPRKADGFFWTREDLGGDGTHPSNSGRQKVADLLLKFFSTDANTRTWFVKSTAK